MTKKIPPKSDVNQDAASTVAAATGESFPEGVLNALFGRMNAHKNAAAVALGRLGGVKGGKARAESLSPEKRKQIAQQAAKKRWENAAKIAEIKDSVLTSRSASEVEAKLGLLPRSISKKLIREWEIEKRVKAEKQ